MKLREIHVVNAPSYYDKIMSLFKPFIKHDVLQMVN